jgi:type III secretion protein C
MELLGRTFGLIWYFDGRVLYVYPSTAVESAVLRLVESSPAQLQRTLDRLGISDSRFPLSFDGPRGTLMVSGPKRYVELVRQAASASDRSPDGADSTTAMRVFGLKFAFADDYTVNSGGREFRVPGVVNILRQAYASQGRSRVGESRHVGLTQRTPMENANGAGAPNNGGGGGGGVLPVLPDLNGQRDAAGTDGAAANGGDEQERTVSNARGVPSFAADPRTNSVIVRDIPSRIEQYEAVIRRLDERPRLVELETNIVEINAEDYSALGIDWRVVGRRAQAEVGGGGISNSITNPRNGSNPAPDNPNNDPLLTLGNIAGTVLGVVAGNRTQLFARISALEQAGKASVSAQPKVMTLNNVEAALDATNTFYVRVQGFQAAQLFDISAGTSIRITPSVVSPFTDGAPEDAAAKEMVRMLIKIEDGGLTDQEVDRLPVVQRTTINTQSLVAEGSTLLIAGYAQERESRDRTAVPGLSRIPVLGNLFKSSSNSRTRVERLFMITPRVVDVHAAEMAKPLRLLPGPPGTAEPAASAPVAGAGSERVQAQAVAAVPVAAPGAAPPAATVAVPSVPVAASAPVAVATPLRVPTASAPATAQPPMRAHEPAPSAAQIAWALGLSATPPAAAAASASAASEPPASPSPRPAVMPKPARSGPGSTP